MVVLFASLAVWGMIGCAQKPILIGFAGQLTGVYSDLGVQGRNGAVLAVEEINGTGGVDGRKLELIVKDDAGPPDRAGKVDRELIDRGVTAIVGHMTSGRTKAALPVTQKAGVVLLSPTASTPELSGKKDMFFRIQASTKDAARILGSFAGSRPEITDINTLRDIGNQVYATPFNRNFLAAFAGKTGNTGRECTFSSRHERHWDEVVQCLAQDHPDGLLIVASARDTASVIQAMGGNKKGKPTVFSSGWAATNAFLAHGGHAVEGTYLVKTSYIDKETPAYKKFARKYRNRFGRSPSFAAVQGYHAIRFLARALHTTGGERKGLPEALLNVDSFDSFYGDLRLDEYGDAMAPVTILKVSGGRFETVRTIRAGEQERQ